MVDVSKFVRDALTVSSFAQKNAALKCSQQAGGDVWKDSLVHVRRLHTKNVGMSLS